MAVTAEPDMAHAQLARLQAQGKLDQGLRYEILRGELVIRGAANARHASAVAVLARHLTAWAAQRGGQCFAGAGVEIGADQLIPDVAVIGPDRVREVDEDGFHVPPDLVAEVTSPGTRSLDLTEKAAIYAEIGVAEYWVVDLTQGRVVVHCLETDRGAAAYEITEHRDGTLTPLVAPDLVVPVAELVAA